MKVLIKSGLLIFVFLISAQISYSCTCVQIKHKEEINKTDYIFVGKLVEIIEDKTYVPPKLENVSTSLQKVIDTRKRYFIKFKAVNKFKGVIEDEITLVQYEQKKELPCGGISFEPDKTYLVYADKDEEKGEIFANRLCSRTQNFDKKSEDYKELLNLRAKKQIETTK